MVFLCQQNHFLYQVYRVHSRKGTSYRAYCQGDKEILKKHLKGIISSQTLQGMYTKGIRLGLGKRTSFYKKETQSQKRLLWSKHIDRKRQHFEPRLPLESLRAGEVQEREIVQYGGKPN